MEPMLDAKREIIDCITGRLPSGGEVAMIRHIADAIEHMAGKGVSIRYLLPKFPDRLQVGLQYMRGEGEVFSAVVSPCIISGISLLTRKLLSLAYQKSQPKKKR